MNAKDLYPLKFSDIFHEKIWGGQRLRQVCGKNLPPGKKIGESWDVCDYQTEVSVVREGPLSGATIRKLLQEAPSEILGPEVAAKSGPELPLLFKFIDANQVLSVQVHPDDQYAAEHFHEDYGKAEAWYVLHADPGAEMILGLTPGTTRADFRVLLEAGKLPECLNSVPVVRGDVIYLPPGTVHAIGHGIVVAEIQQTSDLTYRVFDWNRVEDDGRPRPLHIEDALNVIDFSSGHRAKETGKRLSEGRTVLVSCDQFVFEKLDVGPHSVDVGGIGSFEILSAISGKGTLAWPGGEMGMALGETLLLPASVSPCRLQSDTKMEMLRSYCSVLR